MMRFQQGEKMFLPVGRLVFRPGAGLLALLGFVSVSLVEPACGRDRKQIPLVAVRGSRSDGTSGGGGLRCRYVIVTAGPWLG